MGDIQDEPVPPYMKFTRINENNETLWKHTEKKPLTDIEIKRIKCLDAQDAKSLVTEDKRIWFYSRIKRYMELAERVNNFAASESIIILVDRKFFLRDSFEQFKTIPGLDLRKELKIHFLDEICQDAGGLIREWFTILTEELFSDEFGLFIKTKTPIISYTINPDSKHLMKNHLEYYQFSGQILSKALFERVPIKAYLAKSLIKRLIGVELSFDDLKYFDLELWKSIEFIKNNKIQTDVGTFSITTKNPITNKDETIELKENGKNIPITESNKDEFITLFWKYYLFKSIDSQYVEFTLGFFSLIPEETIQILDCDEFILFLCGTNNISLMDWKSNTKYKGVYSESHPVIVWFWDILSRLTNTELEKFLQFCTGSTRTPAEGFRALSSNNGRICKFSIESKDYENNGRDFLVAHTCFNRLELPLYPNIESMEKVIKEIINTPLCYQFSFE